MGGPQRSRLLDYIGVPAPTHAEPAVPAYHTPVFVPAHPRYVVTPIHVPYVTYELFEHPTDGTVALAFTTLGGLVAALGEAQPWVVTSLGPLAEGVRERGVRVVLDPRVDRPDRPSWQWADLAAYAREVG
ncbi:MULTISPECIES: SAV_915 family protein [Streptomyces]|uniref:SAV_915 family protein n=2 Tax=Streptomyces TaxID=1883 RepID=A0ABV9J9X4_9ACTN